MTKKPKKSSRILTAVYETANDFHANGIFNEAQMLNYKAICSVSELVEPEADGVLPLNDKCQNGLETQQNLGKV
jgi:hypothetical protein